MKQILLQIKKTELVQCSFRYSPNWSIERIPTKEAYITLLVIFFHRISLLLYIRICFDMKNVVPLLFSLFFVCSVCLEYKAKNGKKITERHPSCQNKSVCKELARSCRKKFTKKVIYPPFAGIPSIYDMTQEHDEGQGLTSFNKDFDPFLLFIRKSS